MIARLLTSVRVFIHLTRMGFFFSSNVHTDNDVWGFYRLNFDNGEVQKFAVADFDFAEKQGKVKFITCRSENQRIVN